MKSGFPRWGWYAVGGTFAICLLTAGLAGRYFVGRYDIPAAARELPAAVTAYREAGMPWLASDLRPKPPIPPAEDAGPAMLALAKAWPAERWKREEPEIKGLTGAARTARLAPYNAVLDQARGLRRYRRASIPRDWDGSIAVLFPEFAPWRGIVKGLVYRAEDRAKAKDEKGALAELDAAIALPALIAHDRHLLALLSAIGSERIIADSARRIGAAHPQMIPALQSRFAGKLAPYSLGESLRIEAYVGVALARNLARLGSLRMIDQGRAYPIKPSELRREGLPPEPKSRAYLTRHLQLYTRVAALSRHYRDDPKGLGRVYDRLVERAELSTRQSELMNTVLPAHMSAAGAALARRTEDQTVTRIYLDLVAGRPFPADAKDGFGRPFILRRKGKTFRLYSLGPNGRDDGGLTGKEKRGRESDDVAVLYPPLPR